MEILLNEVKILKACVDLSEKLKNEYPQEIGSISLNALLQSAVAIKSKELLKPARDILNNLKEKLEDNTEIIALDCMMKNLLEEVKDVPQKGGDEVYIKEDEFFINQDEKEEIEIKEEYDIERKLVEYLNNDILDSSIISNCSYIDGTYYSNEITVENIIDLLLAYAVLQGIDEKFCEDEDYSLKDVFEEIEVREFTKRNKFDEPLNIRRILRGMNKFLEEVINYPADMELEFIEQEDLKDYLFINRGKNLKRLKEISIKYKDLEKELDARFPAEGEAIGRIFGTFISGSI